MSEKAKEYVNKFIKARQFDTKRFDDYVELAAFYEGQQHQLTQYQHSQPWVVNINAPYASDAIDIRVASLQSNDYVGELEPLSPDDVEIIEKINDVYHNLWKEMNMDSLIDDAIEQAAVLRESYIHIVYDNKAKVGGTNAVRTGKLNAYFINPASVLIDPSALEFKDAEYIIIVERITKAQAKKEYSKQMELSSDIFTTSDRGEIYLGEEYSSQQDNVLTKWTIYEKSGNVVEKTVLIGSIIVEDTVELPISVYPIAQLRWKKRFKSPYGISLMDRLLPLQKSVNSIESAITNVALQFAAPSFVLDKTKGVNPEAFAEVIGAPGIVLSVQGNPRDVVAPLIQNSVDKGMLEVKRENEQTIYKIAGVSDPFQGALGTVGNTRGGTEQAIHRAKIIEQNFLKNLEEFVEDLTHIIVQFIIHVFAGKTLYTRGDRQADGSFKFGTLEVPENIKDIEYTFGINLDVKTPYSKEKTKALLQELYQIEQQYDSDVKVLNLLDIIKTYDIPNRDELVERYKNILTKDNQTKAEVILEWTDLTSQYGIDPNIIQQGIIEILNGKEMPTVDRVTAQIEQMIQEQAKAVQEQMTQEQALTAQAQVTGDEVFEALEDVEVTGDETFEALEDVEVTGDEVFENISNN